jgi:hypothetical protein
MFMSKQHPAQEKAKSNLRFDLTIISEDMTIQKRLEGVFKRDKAHIRIVSQKRMLESLLSENQRPDEDSKPSTEKLRSKIEIDKMFLLLVDEEMFYIPPMKGMSLNAIATKNQLLILNMKNITVLKD